MWTGLDWILLGKHVARRRSVPETTNRPTHTHIKRNNTGSLSQVKHKSVCACLRLREQYTRAEWRTRSKCTHKGIRCARNRMREKFYMDKIFGKERRAR